MASQGDIANHVTVLTYTPVYIRYIVGVVIHLTWFCSLTDVTI